MVLLCFDDTTNHYVALTLTVEKYFLHPESLKDIQGTDEFVLIILYNDEEGGGGLICTVKHPVTRKSRPMSEFGRVTVTIE